MRTIAALAASSCITLSVCGCQRAAVPPPDTRHAATVTPPVPIQTASPSSSLPPASPAIARRVVGDGLVIGGECPPAPVDPQPPTPGHVPLVAGLTLGHVWKPHSDSGTEEYECLIQVADVAPSYADITYSCNGRDEVARRRLCRADFRASQI